MKLTKFEEGNCVMEMKIGNTVCRICDDYCNYPNQEEINNRISENIKKLALKAWREAHSMGMDISDAVTIVHKNP